MAKPGAGAVDPRNAFDGSRTALFRAYALSVIVTGVGVLALVVSRFEWDALARPDAALWLVLVLVLVGELRPLFTSGGNDVNGLLVTNAFLFAVLLRYGADATVVLQAVVTAIVDLGRRKAPWRIAFNVGQYALAWSVAGLVAGLLGHSPHLSAPSALGPGDLLAALAGGVAYFVVNQLLVSRAVSLKLGTSWRELILGDLAFESLSNGALLALAPLIAVAMERGVAFVPLLLPPLYAVYRVSAVALEREREALSDALTGLPNRKLLRQRTEQVLREQRGGRVALALFDLDRFKDVNDTLGHHVGDELLKIVGTRLAGAVRTGDTVARLGGDEFAMLLPGVSDAAAAQASALRMAEIIAAPIVLEGLLVDVGASVGVAVSPEHGGDLESLLQRADVAMYVAKAAGGGVQVYDPARDRNSTSRLAMLGELRRAIGEDQLVLHFQPIAELTDRRVVAVEALVRWRHPIRGLVQPDDFIPLVERSDVMQPLTAWVLDHAMAQLARWRADDLDLRMAVNVSARDVCGDLLTAQVAAGLRRYGLAPSLLQLEVTEGSFLADPVRALATLHTLRALGVGLSLDDFGTGYSSLRHLRQLPVDEIKIDRSFVHRIDADPRDLAITRGLVDLAHGLGMGVVAEGVETERVCQQLTALGCGSAQGWYLRRPEPADELTPWLRAHVRARLNLPAQEWLAHG